MTESHQPPSAKDPEKSLAAVPWFEVLDQDRRRRVVKSARWRAFEPGDVVFRQGEDFDGLLVIQDGWFKVVKSSADGREQTLQLLGPGAPAWPIYWWE